MSPNKKIKNPRKPKTQKMVEEEEQKINETETSDNSNSDNSKNPENEANEYEKQRQLRIDRNKAKMEAMGLRKIANSLMHLSGNRNSNHKSKRIVKNSKDDDEYEPNEEDPDDDNSNSDCSLDSSSEEFEKEGKKKKKMKKQEKMVEQAPRVLIPDSSLQFTGQCGEKICLMFPKASEGEVKDMMYRFPKGFDGFNCEQGERAFRYIAGLKADYWRLRRLHFTYPEFREEVVEGLPFPEGFKGFTLDESIKITGVIVTLENAYSKLKNCFQPSVKGANDLLRPKASGSHSSEPFHPPATQVSCSQRLASTCVTAPVQPDVPLYPDNRQFPPYWCPHMFPFGTPPMISNQYNANCQPFTGNYSGTQFF